jgi:hypothetical protein
MLFIAAPAGIVKRVALSRAERDPLVGASSREARYTRARKADDVMEGAFWVGLPTFVVGLSLVITGAVLRSRTNRSRELSRVDVSGQSVTIRF